MVSASVRTSDGRVTWPCWFLPDVAGAEGAALGGVSGGISGFAGDPFSGGG